LIIGNDDTTFARVRGGRRRRFVGAREIRGDAFKPRENGVEINQWRQWNHRLIAADRREFSMGLGGGAGLSERARFEKALLSVEAMDLKPVNVAS